MNASSESGECASVIVLRSVSVGIDILSSVRARMSDEADVVAFDAIVDSVTFDSFETLLLQSGRLSSVLLIFTSLLASTE